MPNTPVPAAAEGVPVFKVIKAQDLFAEARDHARLVSMAMESIEQDSELSAIGAGLYSLQKKMREVEEALEHARLAPSEALPPKETSAEYYARHLARAMGAWPDTIRFQITIKPHDPEQPLFWLSMPKPEVELQQIEEVIAAHIETRRLSAENAEGTEAENRAALQAEALAFRALMDFPCRTAEARARKVEYFIAHFAEPERFETWMEFEPFSALLKSLIS